MCSSFEQLTGPQAMKIAHIITSIAFSSALMGCQIEITPLEDEALTDSVAIAENTSHTGTETVTNEVSTTSTDSAASDTATVAETTTDSTATDTSTATDSAATDEATTVPSSTGNTDTTTASNTVTLYWSAPLVRVNGDSITYAEVGGYEIRYKLSSDVEYSRVVINDGSVEQYSFDTLDNAEAYRFEVAAFDVNGIYSDFVTAR
jgi:hypothetical protein